MSSARQIMCWAKIDQFDIHGPRPSIKDPGRPGTVLAVFQKNSPLESTYGLHHRWRPSLRGRRRSVVAAEVTCRSLDKLDDFTRLKRKSKLRGKSARRGEGIERDGQKAAAGLPWTTMTARLARFYLRCSSERPTRANLADRRHDAFFVQYERKTA